MFLRTSTADLPRVLARSMFSINKKRSIEKIDQKKGNRRWKNKSAGEGTPGSTGMNVAAAARLLRILTCSCTSVKDAHERRAYFIDRQQVEIHKGGTAAATAALSGCLRKHSIQTFKVENHFGIVQFFQSDFAV